MWKQSANKINVTLKPDLILLTNLNFLSWALKIPPNIEHRNYLFTFYL